MTARFNGMARWAGTALALVVSNGTSWAAAPEAAPSPSVVQSVLTVPYGTGAVSNADLVATELAPLAKGSARIGVKQGSVRLSLSVSGLPEAAHFGPEYLAYVVWAVTADGRARNLGEIVVENGKGRFATTTQTQAFGVVITAEPYFAIGTPSELVVLRNELPGKAAGNVAPSTASYQAFARGTYSGPGVETPDPKSREPLELYQARNALRIARIFGADRYSGGMYASAEKTLKDAEASLQDKKKKNIAGPEAREAAQAAEAARAAAARMIDEARAAAAQAEAAAETAAAQADAEQARAAAMAAQTKAEAAQTQAAEEARRRGLAERSAEQAEAARQDAEAARQRAEAEKAALRERLLKQFNSILETRDSARGLIVNLGDVLFDVNKFTIRPEAREKLAKLTGIVLANPGLNLAVEGYTDSSGRDAYNQKLSERRAAAVRDYLIQEKVASGSVTARGLGKTRPVASNDTAAGRRKNRRVEIVVSGDVIGTDVEQQKAAAAPNQ